MKPVPPLRTTDEQEIARRRERAAREHFEIRNLTPEHGVFSNFRVESGSGMAYGVEVRDLAWREVFCSCTDFRVNQLGTCKHVEAVLTWLEEGNPSAFQKAIEEGSARIDLVPDPHGQTLCITRNLNDLPPKLRTWFDEEGLLRVPVDEALPALERQPTRIRISAEVERWKAQRSREAARVETRRAYEAAVRSGESPAAETRVPLYPYQREGMLFLAFHERAWLADETGLERRVQAIAACALVRRLHGIRSVLVLTPGAVLPEWEAQVTEYTGLSVGGFRPTKRERPFFTLATYEQAARQTGWINAEMRPDVLVLDEAQRIRDWNSSLAVRIKQLQSRFAFLLASVPTEERLDEIYSLMSVVDPAVFGPLFRFNREFHAVDERGQPVGVQNIDRLRDRMRPHVLRRTRADVASQIPARVESAYFLELPARSRTEYARRDGIARELLAKKSTLTASERQVLERELGAMRILCDGGEDGVASARQSPKLRELDPILRDCLADSGGKVVIFSEWERMVQGAAAVCRAQGIDPVELTGRLTPRQRAAALERFHREAGARVFLATDAVGGSIRVPSGSTVLLLDIPWTAARLEARLGRVVPSDPSGVLRVFYFVTKATIEERLFRRLRSGRAVRAIDAERAKSVKRSRSSPSVDDLFADDAGEVVAVPELLKSPRVRAAIEEARRRCKLARILLAEGFAEEAETSLRTAALQAAIAVAGAHGWAEPTDPAALAQPPLAEAIGAPALGIWRWIESPRDQLGRGIEAVEAILGKYEV